jgi:hypothetical protein
MKGSERERKSQASWTRLPRARGRQERINYSSRANYGEVVKPARRRLSASPTKYGLLRSCNALYSSTEPG